MEAVGLSSGIGVVFLQQMVGYLRGIIAFVLTQI
jgi:hypothetical protein